jgi:methionyl-tRNA formyltransferase
MENFYLFGKGELAIYCAELYLSKFKKESLKIIPVIPEPTWTKSLTLWSKKNSVEIIDYSLIKNIEIASGSIGLSVYFDKIFKTELIKKFERLCNIHNSPLPKYRGVNPINWALKNNEKSHGVTLHIVDKGVDTGDILDQEIFPIDQNMEVSDVYSLCVETGKELLNRNLFLLSSLEPKKQNNENASYYTKVDFDQLGDRKYFSRQIPN